MRRGGLISEAQANQDTVSATTLLSAPFFGAYEVYKSGAAAGLGPNRVLDEILADNLGLNSDNFQGSHWFLYAGSSDGIHHVRWLDPWNYGPFDHAWVTVEEEGADMLTFK